MMYTWCDYISDEKLTLTKHNTTYEVNEQYLAFQSDEEVNIELCIQKVS